jgi:hypothetical protein
MVLKKIALFSKWNSGKIASKHHLKTKQMMMQWHEASKSAENTT